MVTAEYSSLSALDRESDPEGRYKFAREISPMLKTIALPLVSKRTLLGEKSDLMMEAVPYLLAALLEIMLKLEHIVLQEEKESSMILIS